MGTMDDIRDDAEALVRRIVAMPIDDRWGWAVADMLSTLPNADYWHGVVHIPWGDGLIMVDEYADDANAPTVYRVGIYPADEDGCIGCDFTTIVDTVDVMACIALVDSLTDDDSQAAGRDWSAWATHYVDEIWRDADESRGGIRAAMWVVARP